MEYEVYESKHGAIKVKKKSEYFYEGTHTKTMVKSTGESSLKAYKNTLNKVVKTMETADKIVFEWNDQAKKEEPKKFDNKKPRLDLIRPEFTIALGEVLAYGAEKYSEPVGETPNYLKGDGFNYSRIIGSLERHIQQFKMGIDIDEETGKQHLAHAAANVMFLLTYQLTGNGIDDRLLLGQKKESNEAEEDTESGS